MSIRIPLDKIKEGIEHSLNKSSQHLEGAEACISIGNLDAAVILLEFAIEEFGRAVVLRENYKASSGEVDSKLERDHNYKYDKAWTVLPPELKHITHGMFDPNFFDPRMFDTGRQISHSARLEAAFVRYDKTFGKWRTAVQANERLVTRLIDGIRQQIKNFQIAEAGSI